MIRRRLMSILSKEVEEMEKIFESEFTTEEVDTSSAYTTVATINTGLKEGDLDIGEVVIAEIRMLEDFAPESNANNRQLDRLAFLYVSDGYYCISCTGAMPTYSENVSTGASATTNPSAQGVFIHTVGRYMSTLTFAVRQGSRAGRYKILLYKTGFNIENDYREA